MIVSTRLDRRGWQRALDADEESYFNADDDDDVLPSISIQSWSRNVNGVKRKRRPPVRGAPRNVSMLSGLTPPTFTGFKPSKPITPSSPLVDYDDDEPEGDDVIGPKPLERSSNSPSPSVQQKVPPDEEEDDEDRLLEALVRDAPTSRPVSPAPGMMTSATSMGPMRPGEKRRRSEDDDDELLERLTRSKKQDLGGQKTLSGSIPIRTKPGDDPPTKKFKVKIGSLMGGVPWASLPPDPAPSETGAKDGDTG